MTDKPICYDLYAGLGGWAEGFLAEGYECIGFDIEAHEYGSGGYPGRLIIRDILSIHGSELKDATVIVASPPCQAYSYRAMPWKRAKALPPPDNTLFNECFRIQREASAAAGHYIPLIVENVRGAQKWVGRAQWHYGAFFLWGDVPALMPMTFKGSKLPKGNSSGKPMWKDREISSMSHFLIDKTEEVYAHVDGRKNPGFRFDGSGKSFQTASVDGLKGIPHRTAGHWTNPAEHEGVKQAGISGLRENGKGDRWFQDGAVRHGSKSNSRKAASAMIAKIPFPLANYLARHFKQAQP